MIVFVFVSVILFTWSKDIARATWKSYGKVRQFDRD